MHEDEKPIWKKKMSYCRKQSIHQFSKLIVAMHTFQNKSSDFLGNFILLFSFLQQRWKDFLLFPNITIL